LDSSNLFSIIKEIKRDMKTIVDIRTDILASLGQASNPIGILLDGYLKKVIADITRDKLIDFVYFINDRHFNKYTVDTDEVDLFIEKLKNK